MAISAATIWRVRKNGSDTLCSGLFDPTVSGAGTDYTDQDTAQLAITDLACAGSPWTTLTSATGGFTSAMIGNGIYIASGTNFTAGRYIITGRADTNTITVDRAAGATGACSSGVAKIGGALANPMSILLTGVYGAVAGNVVYIRGEGANDPVNVDYTVSTGAANDGRGLTYIGYNGRPKIGHNGAVWSMSATWPVYVENIYFVQTSGTNLTSGVIVGVYQQNAPRFAYNCVFDQGGFNATQLTSASADRCSFVNTGSTTVGTNPTVAAPNGCSGFVRNCLFRNQKAACISVGAALFDVSGNVIIGGGGDGIAIGNETWPAFPGSITNNTIYGCAGHGISFSTTTYAYVYDNIIANITGSGKYGIYATTTTPNARQSRFAGGVGRNNFYGCTNNSNVTMSSSVLTLDPGFVSAPTDLTATNTSLRVLAGVGAL